jgi:putative membrane protein
MQGRGVTFQFGGGSPDWEPRTLGFRLLVNAAGLLLASAIVSGIEIGDWQALVAGTAIFAIVNALLRPVAMLFSCCLIVFTFGLFVVVINAAMLGATAWAAGQLSLNFTVDGFWSAVAGALVISAVSILATVIVRPKQRRERRDEYD